MMHKKSWQQFIKTTADLSPEALQAWLELILTPAEQADIADRIRILKGLLDETTPQRELSDKLAVSISKITRGSNALKRLTPQKKAWLRSILST